MSLLELPRYTLVGTPAEMGRSQGEQLKDLIRGFVAERLRASKVYLFERGIRDMDALVTLGKRCLAMLKNWDNDGWIEHCATAEAAGVDAAELYTAGNMTDIRDILALSLPKAEREGCSLVLIPASHSAVNQVIAAQTWDLNPGDLEFVVAINRKPSQGPATWSITCAGCPSLIGMNEHGFAVGTTNIKTRDARVGIPYLSLLHRTIRCGTLAEAAAVVENAKRAAAHVFWAADRHGAIEWECSAHGHARRDARDVPVCHTNHCIAPAHQLIEGEEPSASSQARLSRLRTVVAGQRQSVDSLKQLFADRSDGVNSVNRFPEDNQGTATNACVICVPARRAMWACKGPSNRGEWTPLGFG